jgi:hypothetical protein
MSGYSRELYQQTRSNGKPMIAVIRTLNDDSQNNMTKSDSSTDVNTLELCRKLISETSLSDKINAITEGSLKWHSKREYSDEGFNGDGIQKGSVQKRDQWRWPSKGEYSEEGFNGDGLQKGSIQKRDY